MKVTNKLKIFLILTLVVPQITGATDGLASYIRKNPVATSFILGGAEYQDPRINPLTGKKKVAVVILPGWPCPYAEDFYARDYFPNSNQYFTVSVDFEDSAILKKTSLAFPFLIKEVGTKIDSIFEKLSTTSTRKNYAKDMIKLCNVTPEISVLKVARVANERAMGFRKTNFGQQPDLKTALKRMIPLWEKGFETIIFGHSRGTRVAIGLMNAIANPDEYADLWKELGVTKQLVHDEKTSQKTIDKEKIEKFGQLIKKIFLANPLLSVQDIPLLKNEKLRSFLGEITRYDCNGKEGIEILRDVAKNKKQIILNITLAKQDETVGNLYDEELKRLCENVGNWNVSVINENHGDIVETVRRIHHCIGIEFEPPRKKLDLLSPKKKELYIFQTLLGLGLRLNFEQKKKLSHLLSDIKNNSTTTGGLKNFGISLLSKLML